MKQPQDYTKRILLAVSGMSPQIVTETLYALAVAQIDQPFIPTEIHLISTNTGKTKAALELLHPLSGKFHQLCNDYGLQGIQFTTDNIHVITDNNGTLLDDIKTPEENEAAADFITQKVNELTRDNDCALHVSIAGGRKTMGYYTGYALSLYGRAQDRLSHVLVTDRYESSCNFFYPTPYSQEVQNYRKEVICDDKGKPLDAKNAQIMLAIIPFVRLIDGSVPQFLRQERVGFSDSVRMAQALEDEPLLKINVKATKNNRLLVSSFDVQIPIAEVDFVFYLWALSRSQSGQAIRRRELQGEPNQTYANEFLAKYDELPDVVDSPRTRRGLENGMSLTFLSERLNATNDAFIAVLGKRAAQAYLIQDIGKIEGYKQYLITLSEEQIQFL